MKELTLYDIKEFQTKYNNVENKQIEKEITNQGIDNYLLNKEILKENPFVFNIDLPSYHLYDQLKSGRCWCFSSINMVEGNIIQNMNINPNDLTLSINYITFFDKLEKANFIYNYVIENDTTIDYLSKNILNNWCGNLTEGSYYTNFANIVNKYGLVPSEIMPETVNTNNSDKLLVLWKEKITKDCLELLNLKSNITENELYSIKKQKLSQMYSFLSKVSGEPPVKFNYTYKNTQGENINLNNITPQEFKNKFLTLNLDDFIFVICNPNIEYYKKYYKEFSSHDYENPYIEGLNVPKEELKELVIKQLKKGIPVKFGCRMSISPYREIDILDTRLHDYENINITLLDYKEGIQSRAITSEHGMVFEGVHLENQKPIRWKVENSHHQYGNQFFVMNDNYFDKYVITANIHKSCLTQKQLESLTQKAIKISNYDII